MLDSGVHDNWKRLLTTERPRPDARGRFPGRLAYNFIEVIAADPNYRGAQQIADTTRSMW
jgi:hypothetical protein